MRIRKGDFVKVLVGKYAGNTGVVLKSFPSKGMVVVEGVNLYKKHQKADYTGRQSAIVDVIKPIPVSNVMLVCPSCEKTTRVGVKIEKDRKFRVCKKCGAKIDVKLTEKKESVSKEKKAVKRNNVKLDKNGK